MKVLRIELPREIDNVLFTHCDGTELIHLVQL